VSQPNPQIRLGIAGSGTIAAGLARAADGICDTVLWARSEESAARVDAPARVVTDLSELSDRDVVVEAVIEDPTVKRDLLARLCEVLPEPTILATTTSSLSIEELGAATGRPDRFCGLHVFNPVHKMDLVELVLPDASSEETRRRMNELCEVLGKNAVEVPDIPGFVVNRLLFPFLFEAVRLADEAGLEPEAVDACMKLGAGHPMGPLALLDFVGLDVAVAIGEQIGAEVPARVRELADAGKLGRKSGSGFYEYG
jgi:3-hydroxybutyryl-CoA dehydrogenase